jgi:hypothetical protein
MAITHGRGVFEIPAGVAISSEKHRGGDPAWLSSGDSHQSGIDGNDPHQSGVDGNDSHQSDGDGSNSHQPGGDGVDSRGVALRSTITGQLCKRVLTVIKWRQGVDMGIDRRVMGEVEGWLWRREISIYTDLL